MPDAKIPSYRRLKVDLTGHYSNLADAFRKLLRE